MMIKITFEMNDDNWGFLDAIALGSDSAYLRELAMEDPVWLLECAENFKVEKLEEV